MFILRINLGQKVPSLNIHPFTDTYTLVSLCYLVDKDALKHEKERLKLVFANVQERGCKFNIHLHAMLSFLSSLPISVLRVLETEANKFHDRNHPLYDAALLTRCYTQHALRPFIDSETNHKGIS